MNKQITAAKQIAEELIKERNETLQLIKKLVLVESGDIVIITKKGFDFLVDDWERTTNNAKRYVK